MVTKISLDDVDQKVRDFLIGLQTDEEQFVLELKGKPIAGLVLLKQSDASKRRRTRLLSMLEEVWDRTKDIPEEEIEQNVAEAIKNKSKKMQKL